MSILFSLTAPDGGKVPSTSVGRAPDYCSAPLLDVPGRLHRLSDGDLFEQPYHGPSYTLDLLSTESVQPLLAGIRFKRRAVILHYSYAGKARLFRKGKHLLTIAHHHLQASAVDRGEYAIEMAGPSTCILFAAMEEDWIRGMGDTLPQGGGLLHGMASGLFVQDTLPHIVAAPDELSPLLEKLHTCDVTIESLRQSKLENYLHKIWLGYERALMIGHFVALRIREEALSCYTDHRTSQVESLAGRCNLTEKTLNRAFKASFGISVHYYIAQHRLWKAWQLIAHKRLAIHLAAEAVGYMYPAAFTRAYKTYFGKKPSDHPSSC